LGPFQKGDISQFLILLLRKWDQYETQIAPLAAENSINGYGSVWDIFKPQRKLDIPIVAIKVVSDILTKSEDNNMQFLEILARGSQMITEVMVKIS
jgi:hypothetical protein